MAGKYNLRVDFDRTEKLKAKNRFHRIIFHVCHCKVEKYLVFFWLKNNFTSNLIKRDTAALVVGLPLAPQNKTCNPFSIREVFIHPHVCYQSINLLFIVWKLRFWLMNCLWIICIYLIAIGSSIWNSCGSMRGLKKTAQYGAGTHIHGQSWWLYDRISPVGAIQWKYHKIGIIWQDPAEGIFFYVLGKQINILKMPVKHKFPLSGRTQKEKKKKENDFFGFYTIWL